MAIRDSLALTEDQRALRDALRGFLADQLPSAALRAMIDTQPGYRPDLHARLGTELSLTGLTIPGEFGGRGLSQAEACVVHTELGRTLYPGPFLASSLAAGVLLAATDGAAATDGVLAADGASAADRTAAKRWLPLLADGSVTGTIAAADKDGRWSSAPGSVRAHLTPHGWRLYGSCWYVIAAHVASVLVVSARAGSVPAVFLVEADAAGLRSTAQRGLDLTRRVYVTTFDATPAVLLAQDSHAVTVLQRAERDFLVATAAEAVGGISWCLDTAVLYARDRQQFGRPAGSFQTVAGVCVDMLEAFQSAEAATRYAAVAAAAGAPEAPTAARVAALRAGQAYRTVTETAIRLFDGIGSTWEHDAHLYYRRAWSAERLAGGPQAHRAALTARQLAADLRQVREALGDLG
jgi:alkylation response protein AidB-like acyl-CoA dehydrogenase